MSRLVAVTGATGFIGGHVATALVAAGWRVRALVGRPDAVLPDGSRFNILFGGEVSKRGSNLTIRKF